MAGFDQIYGQGDLKRFLEDAVSRRAVANAYIIAGERGSWKEYIAYLFAKAILCEADNGPKPCGECHSCKQAAGNNHPDLIHVTHEKPGSVGVEDIRNQINNDIVIQPYSSEKKIYIMNEGEKMTPQAQNALLKTLEEPPEYGVIMILVTDTELLLPTIISRCVVLQRKPVSDQVVRKYLMEEVGIPDYRAKVCVAFARGNLGKARLLAVSEEFDKIQKEALALLKYIQEMELTEIVNAIKKISEYKLEVNDYLDIIAIWYRDVLLFKATGDANLLVFQNELAQIGNLADVCSYEGLENILEALEKAKSRLRANVNFELTMELLLVTMSDSYLGGMK